MLGAKHIRSGQALEDDTASEYTPKGKVGGNSRRYFDEARRPEGITDNIPGVRWQPAATPRFYCTRESHHGSGRINEVFFYFNIGEVKQTAAATGGVDATSLPLAILAHAMGSGDITWLGATDALRCLGHTGWGIDFIPLASQFVRLSIPAGIAAERQLTAPQSGFYDYPSASVLTDIAASGHSKARGGDIVPPAAMPVVVPTPSPQSITMPDPGAFAQWLTGQAQPADDLDPHIADAYYRIYVPLHRDDSIRDADINALIDVLAKSAEHTVLVQDAYNAGINDNETTDKLVAELVDYAARIRESPRRGSIRNFIIYLLIRAGATVTTYDIPIHRTDDDPFRIEAVYAPVEDGIPRLPVEAQSWFRLHVNETPTTASLFNLRDGQSYTISWFIEYDDASENRVTVLPAYIEEAHSFAYYREQDRGDSRNPFFAKHTIDAARTGKYKIIASIAWWEQLHAPGEVNGPSRPHVHFVEQECVAITVRDRLQTATAGLSTTSFGGIAAGYYARAAYTQAMPADIAHDLESQVIAPLGTQSTTETDAPEAVRHYVTIDAPGVRQVRDGRSFVAQFSLTPLDQVEDTSTDQATATAKWYVASTAFSRMDHAVTGSRVDPRLVADASFLHGGDGADYAFATMVAGDYAIVAVPSDGSHPVMYPLRVFDEHDREAQLACSYTEQANKLQSYADAGFRASEHSPAQPYTVNPATQTRFVPLVAAHMSKKTGAITPLNLYLATTDPDVDWAQLAAGDVSSHNGFRLIDAGLGKPQSVYEGGTIDHCFTRFDRENGYPTGWISISIDFRALDPDSQAAPVHYGPYETKGQSDMSEWAGWLGGRSLAVSLAGMGLALSGSVVFAPLGVMCLVVGQMAALASTVASLQANRLHDEVDKKLIWIDVVGLAAGLAGLAGLGRLVIGASGAIAGTGQAARTAVHVGQLGRMQMTLGLADTALSGAEVLLMGSHAYSEIDKILGRKDLDGDQKTMLIAASLANVVIGGTLWALGARGDVIGHKPRQADQVAGKRQPGGPIEEGGRAPGSQSLVGLTPETEEYIGRFLDFANLNKLKKLQQSDPHALDHLLRKLTAEVERYGGWSAIESNQAHRDSLRTWFFARLTKTVDVDETAIMIRLTDDLRDDVYRDLIDLLTHYRAMRDAAETDGYARRFLADIYQELQENGLDACTTRIHALMLIEFGATPLRIRRFLEPVYRLFRVGKFEEAARKFRSIQEHFFDRGYQSFVPPATRRLLEHAYRRQRVRALRRVEARLLRNAADTDGNRTLGEQAHARFRALLAYYERADGALDGAYAHILEVIGGNLAGNEPKLVALKIYAEYIHAFGYNEQIAQAILDLDLRYFADVRSKLAQWRLRGPELRQLDAARSARSGEPASGPTPKRRPPDPTLADNPTTKAALGTLRDDLTWLIPSKAHKDVILEALRLLVRRDHTDLLIAFARSSDSAKRAFFTLLRVCQPFNDPDLAARALESLMRRNHDDLMSTRTRQDAYDTNASRFRTAYPGGPDYGDAANSLPSLRNRDYDECTQLLHDRGFRPVEQWPVAGDDITRVVWFHSGDGSVVRIDTWYTASGAQQTSARRSVMQLDDNGKPFTPRLDNDNRELYRVADAAPTGDDYTVFDPDVPNSERSADPSSRSRLPTTQADADTHTRERLSEILPDGGASLTQHDVQEITTLWASVTEVPLVRAARDTDAQTATSARTEPEAQSPAPEPTTPGPRGLGGPAEDPLTDQVNGLITMRADQGIETSASDAKALRTLLERNSEDHIAGITDILTACKGLDALVELELAGDIHFLQIIRAVTMGRLALAAGDGLESDLTALLRMLRILGPEDALRNQSGFTLLDRWDLLGTILKDDDAKGRAILKLSCDLPVHRVCEVELYSDIYDKAGDAAFRRHTDGADATLVVLSGQNDALENSARHFDDTQMLGHDTPQPVRPEHTGGPVIPTSVGDDNDALLGFIDAGKELGQHGFRVVLLDKVERPDPPKMPMPPNLDDVPAADRARVHDEYEAELDAFTDAVVRHKQSLLRQGTRDEFLAWHGLRDRGQPLYTVNDRVTEVYNVADVSALSELSSDISMAAAQGYSRSAVIYLKHGGISADQVWRHLQDQPPLLVENCLVIDGAGVHRVWPSPAEGPQTFPRRD